MPKRGILLVIFCMSLLYAFPQEITHEVLVPAASVAIGGGYSISQTIGEPIVDFISSGGFDLTQGFQQPGILFEPRPKPQGTGVKVYPNPVYDHYLKLELFGETGADYVVTLFGMDGSIYLRNIYKFEGKYWALESLDLTQFKRGIYFVRVTSSDKKISRLFKIEIM